MKDTISNNLKIAIENDPRKSKELAELLGFGKNTLSSYANNELPDNIYNFLKLSRELGIDVEYLFTGINKGMIDPKYDVIIKLLDSLDERELIKIEGFLEDKVDDLIGRRSTSTSLNNTG